MRFGAAQPKQETKILKTTVKCSKEAVGPAKSIRDQGAET